MQKRVRPDQPGADVVQVICCGVAEAGKTTLIERLQTRTSSLPNQLALHAESLEAGSEQLVRRKILVTEVPGVGPCVRRMIAAASTAEVAIILVDGRKGVLAETRRQLRIAALLGIRHLVLVVNKMDLADYAASAFHRIVEDYRAFAEAQNLTQLIAIPVSSRLGDNITNRSNRMPWYDGPALLEHLEAAPLHTKPQDRPFRMPVLSVDPPGRGARGISGTIACGRVRSGDRIVVAQSGRESSVRSIEASDGLRQEAFAGDTVALTLADEVNVLPGDLLVPADQRPEVSDQFAAHVMWAHDEPLIPGRPYLLTIGSRSVTASVTEIKHREDLDTLQKLAAKTLLRDEIGFVNVETHEPVAFDPYDQSRETGSFALVDRASNLAVGTGMIRFGLRRATNVHWQALDVTKASRARLKGQMPCCLWFTGLSGSGKSTIANLLEKKLQAHGRHTFTLDGDNTRHGLNRDLGFTDADRVENIRRAAHVARLMVDAGLIVLVSFISPFEAERRMARELFDSGEFLEVFVDTPLEICEQRDVKGLYRKARAGQIQNFTGISSRYEPPSAPDVHLQAAVRPAAALADQIYDYLHLRGYFHAGPAVARIA